MRDAREMRRAFLAVVPPASVLDAIAERVDDLRGRDERLRWMVREQWHTTLQFLGRVDDADELVRVVGDTVRAHAPFVTRLGGGGALPKRGRATLLWLGHGDGVEHLGELAASVGAAAATLGFAPDDRRFRPHVTIARARQPRDLRPVIDAIGTEPVGPEWTVEEIVLFESETLPDGARYTARARTPLGG